MVLGQTLETTGGCKTLGHQDSNGDRDLVFLSGRPSVDILQKGREGRLFQRLLKIFVSERVIIRRP